MLRRDEDLSLETSDVTRTGVCLFDSHVNVDGSLLFVTNVRRYEVICLVRSNISSDALNFSLELLKEGATLALIKCTMLYTPVKHTDQKPRKSACLRLRSGVRFHAASEN